MELTRIPDIGPVYANILVGAGIRSIPELAAVADLDALSAATKVHPSTLEAFRAAARTYMEGILEQAGIRSIEELAQADAADVARKTGLASDNVASFQRAARAQLGLPEPAAPAAPPEPPQAEANEEARTIPIQTPTPTPKGPDRVVLADGRATANVRLGEDLFEGVPIITARANEDAQHLLARAGESAVLLQEGAHLAPVRVRGETREPLPIFKTQGDDEIRVRVKEIKDKPVAKKSGGLLQRFLKRG